MAPRKSHTLAAEDDSLMHRKKEPLAFSDNFVTQRKIENACDGLPYSVAARFLDIKLESERLLIAGFLSDLQNSQNARPATKKVHFFNMLYLLRFLEFKKSVKEITKDDMLTYLQTVRRSLTADPSQKWIATHNQRVTTFIVFFKWLYFSDVEPSKREKPPVVEGLPYFKKKEATSVKAQDLWLPEEDAVFLKYCEDPRIQLFHTMADDTSGRPHEILASKIGDVKIKNANGRIFGEVEIGRGGKTKSRTVPLIVSLPYYKAWLARHPDGSNPNAYIFRSNHPSAKYRNIRLNSMAMNRIYRKLKKEFFPRLLDRADIPPEDKQKIASLLQKPWNPYIRRHTSLTEKAKLVNEYVLRLHAGWTKSSKMVSIYTHELGGESNRELLAAYGILPKHDSDGKMDLLQPKLCPNCKEPNKVDARFCANGKCGLPLTFDAYGEMKERENEKEKQFETVQEQMGTLIQIMAIPDEKERQKAMVEAAKKWIEKGTYRPLP